MPSRGELGTVSPRLSVYVANAERRFVRRAYDAFGNLALVSESDGTWPVGAPNPTWGVKDDTRYTYDALGRLTATQDAAGNPTTIGYDAFGQKESLTDPDMGAWSYGYDAAGNLTRQTDARGKTLCYAYDGLNRLTTVQEDTDVVHDCQGTLTGRATHSYDAYDGSNQFGVGRRTSLTNSAGSVSWVYDRYGRVTQETRSVYGIGGGTFVTGYGYNAADRLTSVTYPDGEAVNATYTAALLPNSLSSSLDPYVSSSVYDAAGRLDLRVFRPNDLQTDYVYYAWSALSGGRLNQLRSGIGSGGAGLQNLTYAYDLAGNVTRIRDDHNSGQRQCFVYDALNRLKQAHIGDANCVALSAPLGNGFYEAQTYDYSTDGNLWSQTALGSYTYNAPVSGCSPGTLATKPHAVRQAGSHTYSYDCNGNQTGRTLGGVSASLSYDAENRLTGVSGSTTAAYAYDGDGQRVKATLGSGDGAAVTAYAGRLWEQTTRYQETNDDGLAQGWTATSGTWTVTGGRYQQSSLSSNTNSYRALAQNGPLYYRWVATYTSGTNAGLYLMASAGTGAERGNSYRIWQDATHVRLYENANNLATVWDQPHLAQYGPECVDLTPTLAAARAAHPIRPAGFLSYPSVVPEEACQTRWIADRAIHYVEQRDRSRPFFLKVSFVDPHDPYDPPARFLDLIDPAAIPPPRASDDPALLALLPRFRRVAFARRAADVSPDEWRTVRRYYLASLAFIDEQVGRIRAALAREGLTQDTAVIFTADHGDMLGDYGLPTKGPWHFDACMRVPLLVAGPGVRAAAVEEHSVTNLDLFPTITELAGAAHDTPLEGRSLVALCRGDGTLDRPDAALVETYGSYRTLGPHVQATTVVTPHARLTRIGDGGGMLFDLGRDPQERTNLYGRPEAATLQAALTDLMLDLVMRQYQPLPNRNRQMWAGGMQGPA